MSLIGLLTIFILTTNAMLLTTVSQEGAPFKYKIEDPVYPGICYEILKEVEKNNTNIRFQGIDRKTPLTRVELYLKNNTIDTFFCLMQSPERLKNFDFIDVPLFKIRHVVLTRKDFSISISNYEELKKQSEKIPVLVQLGSSLEEDLRGHGIKYDAGSANYVDNIKKVLNSRADIFYGQDLYFYELLRSHPELQNKVKIHTLILKEQDHFVAVSRKIDKEKLKILTKEIQKIKQNGFLKKINKKYVSALIQTYSVVKQEEIF